MSLPTVDLSVSPALPSDVVAMLPVHIAAMRHDLVSHLFLLDKSPVEHFAVLSRHIELWVASPAYYVMKACNPSTGEVVGWSCWAFKNYGDGFTTGQEFAIPAAATTAVTAAAGSGSTPGSLPALATAAAAAPHQTPRQLFGAALAKENARWEAQTVGDTGARYMTLQALFTLPAWQGRGIGTELLRWGLQRADDDDVPIYTHSSPAAWRLYQKMGSEKAGSTEWDLSEYAPGGKEGGRGWGPYVFYYMIRKAKHERDGK